MNSISSLFWKQKWLIFLTLTADCIFLAVDFVWNSFLSKLIDSALAGNALTARIIVRFAIIFLLYIVMNGISTFLAGFVSEKINFTLRNTYISGVAEKGYDYFQNVSGGERASILLNELNSVCGFISDNLFFILDSAIKFVGTFGWFLILNPKLAILSNLPVVFILLYVTHTSRILKTYTVRCNEEKARLNGITESLMTLFPVIRLYEAGTLIVKQYEHTVDSWESAVTVCEKRSALLMSISALITCIPLLLTILIGGNYIIGGTMTVGSLYIFLNLSGNVSGILMNMPSFIMQLRVFAGNLEKMEVRFD